MKWDELLFGFRKEAFDKVHVCVKQFVDLGGRKEGRKGRAFDVEVNAFVNWTTQADQQFTN